MLFPDDEATVRTIPLDLPEVGPVASIARRIFGWPNPFRTVTIAVLQQEHLLVIYREPRVHVADWDIAEGLMNLVAHPNRRFRGPSLIRDVSAWDIRQVESAAAALAQLIENQRG